MDITGFINSKDIREHHRAIGYEYNALEAAWLVSQCQHATLEEKHEAWRWIIENMPDCGIEERGRRVPGKIESVHAVLAGYMKMEDEFIERFKDASGGYLYFYRSWYRTDKYCDSYSDMDCIFTSYEDCFKYVMENEDPEDISIVEITRRLPGEDSIRSKGGNITVNLAGTIMKAVPDGDEKYEYSDFFDSFWFVFPVPFERGDIVYRKNEYRPDVHTPIVVDSIVFPDGCDKEEFLARRREFGDPSDMCVWGYAADEEWCTGYNGPYRDSWWNYMDAEYYREELKGIARVLGLISNWLKGKLGDDVDLLMAGYHHIMLEEMLAASKPALYTDEALRLAGFEVDEDKDGK